jgi:uncharacterized protein YecT (DUF1311 family)
VSEVKHHFVTILLIIAQAPLLVSNAADSLCANAVTSREMEQCMAAELQKAEKLLDGYLVESTRQVTKSTDARRALEAAQAAWQAYRDAHCRAVYAAYAPGSMAGLQVVRCKLQLTQRRTHELWQTYIDNRVSDLTEPKQ